MLSSPFYIEKWQFDTLTLELGITKTLDLPINLFCADSLFVM